MTKQDPDTRLPRRTALKLGAVTGASALVGSFAGCTERLSGGGSSDEGKLITDERIGSEDAETELTHWLLPEASHTYEDNPAHAKVYEQIFRTWAQNHPDAKIELEYQTNLEQMKTKLLQTAAKGSAPSMAQVDSFWVPNFSQHLQPVTDVIEDEDDWFPFVKEVMVNDGEWQAVWKNTDCRTLYYRQDLIDKYNDGNPPETWDQLITVGQDIKDNEGMAGYMYNGGKWEATTFDNLAMYWAQGADLVNDQGKPVLDEPSNKKALLNVFEFFKRTIDSGVTPKRIANINDYALLEQAALNGETAMFLGGNWQISTIKETVDSKEEWQQWKVAKIPQMSSNTASTGTGGWTVGVFTQDDAERTAAKEYAGQYSKKENMAEFCKTGAYLPTRKSVFESSSYFSEDPYQQVYQELLKDGRARPGVPIYLTISSEWQIAAGKVITGQATPQKAVETMITNVNSEYGG
ncbi:extracellular solute-binding protein [Halegenticoccus tardaugens]|uniref:extracellular solute-binding protein n=1 Tax=Halegenticoccus tardaugens TaxID=2071624 RepID=UPI0013E9318A|nr:extracellular solute-binding protein [Halegenticoccus tardaugens]